MSHYTMLFKYGNCTRQLKIKTSWKSVVFTYKVGKNSPYFVGVSNTTIIPPALVGYEIIIAKLAARRLVGYLPSHIQRALVE